MAKKKKKKVVAPKKAAKAKKPKRTPTEGGLTVVLARIEGNLAEALGLLDSVGHKLDRLLAHFSLSESKDRAAPSEQENPDFD